MYVAVKGGETAVRNSRRLVARAARGPEEIPGIRADQIEHQLGLGVDRVMAEGALYDTRAAANAIKQAQGDMLEAIFLVRAFRSTLKRFGNSRPVDTGNMKIVRRISGAFKDIPGGQILGPTYDYTHRLIQFENEAPVPEDTKDAEPAFRIPAETAEVSEGPRVRVTGILKKQGLMTPSGGVSDPDTGMTADLTRHPLKIPAGRSIRLQALARGDEGFLLGSAYSLQRGFGMDRHPFLGELRVGYVDILLTPPELGFEIRIGEIKVTECVMISRNTGSHTEAPGFEAGYGLVFGQNERKAMSIALLDRSLQNSERDGRVKYPAQDQEFILCHCDNVESSGFVQHLKMPHYVDFQSELVSIRHLKKTASAAEQERQEDV